MSDFDPNNAFKNELVNPFTLYGSNNPTVFDVINNPEKYLGSTQVPTITQPKNPNNETIPKTNFFNKKAPDIKRNQPYDCFTVMNNDIKKINKKRAAIDIFGAIAAALAIGLISGKRVKMPKLNLPKFKLPKMKVPKWKMPKLKLPNKNTFSNLAQKFKASSFSKKMGEYTAKVKNFVAKKTA